MNTENIQLETDERFDTIAGTDFSLIQKIDGTAFTIDTLLLANFTEFKENIRATADLGTGSGILAFLIKYRKPDISVTGYEIQEEFYNLAVKNAEINSQFTGMYFENMDIRDIPSRCLPESFDLVVSNPPYFPAGNGRLPTKKSRAFSRHELNGTLKDFVEAASYMLTIGGKFCLVIPTARFYEVCKYFKEVNFGLRRLQFVMPKEKEKSHLVLIEAELGYRGNHKALPNITIHKSNGEYSDELNDLFKLGLPKFNLND